MSQGVMLSKIYETSTTGDFPTSGSAVTWTQGVNAPGGPVEFLMLRLDATWAGDPAAADISNLVNNMRIIINGEVAFDYRAGYAVNTTNAAGCFGAFLNQIGGRYYEVPGGTTTREAYWAIPIGRQLPNAVNRFELIVGWAAAAESITSGSLEWWLRTNTGMTQQTTVVSPTSYTHAANTIEMVTVRIPANVPGTVAGILVQNDSAADELGTQGIRVNSLSQFGVEVNMWRFWNGDLANGIMFAEPTQTSHQKWAFEVAGFLFIPTFNLAGGQDIVLQVNSTAATTRTYTPVIVSPVNARAGPAETQTARVKGSPTAAIVARSEN
tara:strand:- start:298 stop:1272 length:975 start_codon:yes stop_codon:yes gene_type:complete